MIDESVFQSIYNELAQYLFSGWEKLVVYLEYGEASYTFAFYEKVKGTFVKCFDLPGVPEDKLMESFSRIDKVVGAKRGENSQENWTNMTMVVTPDGHMRTEFDYTDLATGTYQFRKEWKRKFLV